MAHRRTETERRILTGVAGGAALLFLLWAGGHVGVSFVTAVIALAMAWELSRVFLVSPDQGEKRVALLGVTWLFVFLNMVFPRTVLECLLLATMGLFTYYLAVANRHSSELRRHFDELVFSLFILLYVVSFVAFLPLIRDSVNGFGWTVLFLCIVWANDTGAYFVGRRYGRRRMYPLISPGKTWEGAAGGLAAGMAVTLVFKLLVFRWMGWLAALLTPLLVGVVSQIGDLCESFLKRACGIKDSGKILPGHGGMLDRFDGVLFSLPLMYFCVKAFG